MRLSVGQVEVTGEGSTAQAAKHSAAANALQKLKDGMQAPPTGSAPPIKSNLNPASVPFVPSSAKSASPSPQNPPAGPTPLTSTTSKDHNQHSKSEESVMKPKTSTCPNASADPMYSELKSAISLVHENALKRNMTVKFEVARETGPPHMRTFLTR